jgi:hypothetical protein
MDLVDREFGCSITELDPFIPIIFCYSRDVHVLTLDLASRDLIFQAKDTNRSV